MPHQENSVISCYIQHIHRISLSVVRFGEKSVGALKEELA
jgi:hypothetical protein